MAQKYAGRDNLVKLFRAFYAEQKEINEATDKDLDEFEKALAATDAKIPTVKCDEAAETLIISTNEAKSSEAETTGN